MIVVKVGGSLGIDYDALCQDVAALHKEGQRLILVHGGSAETNRIATALGHPPRFVTSPSQSYGVMMSMPAVMLLLEVLRPQRRAPRLTWLALAASLLALAGSKATFLPIFTAAAVALWLIELVRQRRIDRTVTAVVALLVAATAFAQLVIFGGRTGSLALDPFETADAALLSQEIEPTTFGSSGMNTAW